MSGKRLAVLFVLAFLAAVGSLPGMAQTQGGSLQGKITDEAGQPVAGALIEVRGPALQAYLGTATDTAGQYQLPFVPTGRDYEVKVEAPGYNTVIRKGIDIPLGAAVHLPFTLSQGKTEIVVTAAAPVVDLKRTEVGANISDKMINSIPLMRDSAGIAYLAPGAVASGLTGAPAINGASGPENAYIVNGVDTTGSRTGLNNTSLNFDFIEATEVKTGGMDAEYGALMGGMVSSVTKSGGNEFHGGLFAYYFDDGLGAKERPYDNPNVISNQRSFKQFDIGGSLGGYFVKDKLWFFAAYDYNKTETGYNGSGTDPQILFNGQPSYSWSRYTGYTNTETDPQYAFKLTWNVSPNHKIALSYFGDNSKFDGIADVNNPSPIPSGYIRKLDNYAVSLQWNATWTPKFFTEAIISRRDTERNSYATNPVARESWYYYYLFGTMEVIPVGPPNSYDAATGRIDLAAWRPSLGGVLSRQYSDVSDQLRLKATNLLSGAGRHELSYGLQVYDIHYDDNLLGTGPGYTELWPGDIFYGRTSIPIYIRWQYSSKSPSSYWFRAQSFMNDQNKKTTQTYSAYWVQDNWNISDYFMLKVGLRLDQIHMKGSDNTLNVPDQIAPGHGYATGKARSVNINDQWAPRIGFTWDVAHNSKSKLYGFWGQYYERIPNDMAIRALTDEYMHFSYFSDAALTQTRAGDAYHYTYGFLNTQIVGGPGGGRLKGSYNEEAILGFQYEIRPDFNMGVRAVYRNIGRVIEDISVDGGSSYIVTNPDQWVNVWVPDPFGRPGYRWRFPKPVRIYKALEITMDKRFSNHWMMQGSYVLSRLEGNYEGLYSNDNGQLDPNITSKYDIPSLLVNGYGLLPNDRTHVLKLYGGYFFETIPLELTANLTLQSGIPISALGADDAYGINEGFAKVRGTAGRTPTLWALDLGAQYTFKIWKSNLALRVDIFNVTNEQRTTTVDQTFNTVNTSDHQNWPYFKMETAHQQARRIRLAIRWTF